MNSNEDLGLDLIILYVCNYLTNIIWLQSVYFRAKKRNLSRSDPVFPAPLQTDSVWRFRRTAQSAIR